MVKRLARYQASTGLTHLRCCEDTSPPVRSTQYYVFYIGKSPRSSTFLAVEKVYRHSAKNVELRGF